MSRGLHLANGGCCAVVAHDRRFDRIARVLQILL